LRVLRVSAPVPFKKAQGNRVKKFVTKG